jgi:beta-N-acetylhexosaminidase
MRLLGLPSTHWVVTIALASALPLSAPGDARAAIPTRDAGSTMASRDSVRPGADWVEQTLASLSLERKIGQLICPDIAGGYIASGDARLQQWIRLAHDYGVGMFVLYGGTPRDVAHLLNRLQKAATIPILMAADFEGGPGQQVTGASEYPANMAFAAVGSDELVYRATSAAAVEGRAMGIHLTYTPVVDIAWRPENPAESVRSFGGDLDLLGRMVRAYVRGYHENGMLTSAKHFPGRGDVENMPGKPGWTWNAKPAADMRAQEFTAFKHGIDAGVDFVMSEHIAVPSVTGGSDLPASVEKKLATGWLRDSLGFKGILTSDDLWYDQVVARFGAEEVAIKAFEAGHDIILKPKDPVATIAAMAAAVRSGRISEQRIDQAVRKLLTLKAKLKLNENRFVDEGRVDELVGTPAHQALVQEVADRSLTLLKNDGVLPTTAARLAKAVNINIQKDPADLSPLALSAKLSAAYPGMQSFSFRPDMDSAAYDRAWQAVSGAEVVIVSLFVPRNRLGDATPIRPADLAFLQRVIAAKPRAVIAMSYGNPHLIRQIPSVGAFLVGYGEKGWFGNQTVYFESFTKALTGALKPSGKLPVRVSADYPIGAGTNY